MHTKSTHRYHVSDVGRNAVSETASSLVNAIRNMAASMEGIDSPVLYGTVWELNPDKTKGEVVFTSTMLK